MYTLGKMFPTKHTFYFDLPREDRAAYPDCDIHYALEKYVTVTPFVQNLTSYSDLDVINLEPYRKF